MQPQQILSDQQITIKRGRTNGLGFEPAFNSFFDFYLDTRYFDPPLLRFQDVAFFLYLRKNLNDNDPNREMPSIRAMRKKFGVSQDLIEGMLGRLDRAKLVVKVSGLRTGIRNARNEYILSDPISQLEQFLTIRDMGLFDVAEIGTLQNGDHVAEIGTYVCAGNRYTPAPEIGTPEQTSINREIWTNILSILNQHLGHDQTTFFDGSRLESLEGGIATIVTNRAASVDWLNRQMGPQLRRMLSVETGSKISAVVVRLAAA